jgi:hypothetical protein
MKAGTTQTVLFTLDVDLGSISYMIDAFNFNLSISKASEP